MDCLQKLRKCNLFKTKQPRLWQWQMYVRAFAAHATHQSKDNSGNSIVKLPATPTNAWTDKVLNIILWLTPLFLLDTSVFIHFLCLIPLMQIFCWIHMKQHDMCKSCNLSITCVVLLLLQIYWLTVNVSIAVRVYVQGETTLLFPA